MRIVEILLPPGASDRSLSPHVMKKIDALQQRMSLYTDKILDPAISAPGKEFLKSKLRDDYYELRDLIPKTHQIAEAVHRLPLSNDDFELALKLFEKPIPAAIAPIYILDLIEDDELTDQLRSLEESEPSRDVRPLIVEWFKRVMPDQMYRFTGELRDINQRQGILSPIHGYDPHMYKGQTMETSGNAYGRT